MKRINKILSLVFISMALFSCEDEIKNATRDFANDVTFNKEENSIDVTVPELDFLQMDKAFTARAYQYGSVTLNARKNPDGTHSGFALSNKNYRSYPWCNSEPKGNPEVQGKLLQAATDTLLYSCYTGRDLNLLKNFVVARIDGEDAYFTVDQPRIVEHVLIANCTFNYLALQYGSVYSSNLNADTQEYERLDNEGKLAVVRNPNMPDPATSKYGVWNLPDYYDFAHGEKYVKMPAEDAYLKVIATGYNGSNKTGSVEYYLAVRPGVAPAPCDTWNLVQSFWAKWDLSPLGVVDKVVFTMDSSVKDAHGNFKLAPYICLDAIGLK